MAAKKIVLLQYEIIKYNMPEVFKHLFNDSSETLLLAWPALMKENIIQVYNS